MPESHLWVMQAAPQEPGQQPLQVASEALQTVALACLLLARVLEHSWECLLGGLEPEWRALLRQGRMAGVPGRAQDA